MKWPTIYEANSSGPPITLHDRVKTAVALEAVAILVSAASAGVDEKAQIELVKRLGKDLSEAVGMQWSMLTAMQYLTGQRADKAIRRWADDYSRLGFRPQVCKALVAMATDFCANGVSGKVMSSGLLVKDFRDRPLDLAMLRAMLGDSQLPA